VNYVVGSGAAGVACAHALVTRGLPVTLLDAGIELEAHLRTIVDDLRSKPPGEWDRHALEAVRRPIKLTPRGISWKSSFGSAFPYCDTTGHVRIECHGVEGAASLAKGGLSNVWGGATLPYRASDLADWPIDVEVLRPHYEAVAELLGIVGAKDRLEEEFPLYGPVAQPLRPSRQAAALMADLESAAETLRTGGYLFGHSRLAVAASHCRYCGLCQYGCPYRLVYNAASTLERLRERADFSYRPDVIVEEVVESGSSVRILGVSRSTGARVQYDGARVFLASGALPTTKILLASLHAYDTPVTMRDSQSFVFPMMRFRGTPGVLDESLYTLAQVFLELADPALTERVIHLQLCTYNHNYLDALRDMLGPLHALSRWAVPGVMGRLLTVQGFLHSDDSARIRTTLRRDGARSTLVLEAMPNPQSRRVIEGVLASLRRHRGCFRAVPLSRILRVRDPGGSFHVGGTFPMRATPGPFESDRLGRPCGLERVHAVDATVFPTIPGLPILYSIAANAHRIATECAV
jgi:choline dehydrogenase-like flavoprotein